MINIVFDILSGTPNFTAHISPNVAVDQILTEYGTYSFTNIPEGEYIITITDANGCISRNSITTTTTSTTINVLPCTLTGIIDCNYIIPPPPTPTYYLECNVPVSPVSAITEYQAQLNPLGGTLVFEFKHFLLYSYLIVSSIIPL